MRMVWIGGLVLLVLMGFALPLVAQEVDSDPDDELPAIVWDSYVPDVYRAGDKILTISAGVLFPTVFTGRGLEGNGSNINIGGMGSFVFSYFLTPRWFVGGELAGMFASTGGRNMVFIIPIGPRVGYQFVLGRFEFPLALMVGAAPQKYLDKGYFGLIIKPSASGFFRFNPDWSFGLNTSWWLLPQWPENGKNVLGNFLELTLSARYHF